jgi:hypothetical protein
MEKVCTDSAANRKARDEIKKQCGLDLIRQPLNKPVETATVNDPEYLRRAVGKKSEDWYSL